jgi:hypothetical protein
MLTARQLPGGLLFGPPDFHRTALAAIRVAAPSLSKADSAGRRDEWNLGARHFAASCQCPRFPETITVRTPNL